MVCIKHKEKYDAYLLTKDNADQILQSDNNALKVSDEVKKNQVAIDPVEKDIENGQEDHPESAGDLLMQEE